MAQTWDLPMAGGDSISSSRTDLNNAAEALRTLHSGTSAPTSTVAYMLWADTTNTLLKMRNSGDSAWLELGTLAANLGMLRIDGSNAMTGNLSVNGADSLIVDLGRSGDTANARIDLDDAGTTSIRASAASTITFEVAGNDEAKLTAAKLDLGLVNDYVLNLGKSGDTNNGRIDFTSAGNTSIRGSAANTIAVEINGDADFVVINSNGIICTAGELRSGGDNGGGAGLTTVTNATAANDSTSATVSNTPTGIAGASAAWMKIYIGTTAAYIPYWTA